MNSSPASLTLTPIGYLHCEQRYRYEAPRQGVLADETLGLIRLQPHCNYEQALDDLLGFDRIWLLYHFHHNTTWKPKVRPPRINSKRKIGVFATRSPHRPNPIGLSCVELVDVQGLTITIRQFDLLDGTPILDIKPYLPYSDAFAAAATGWVPQTSTPAYTCQFSPYAQEQAEWIYHHCSLDLQRFAALHLAQEPLSAERKRVTSTAHAEIYCLACRTWRLYFRHRLDDPVIVVEAIASGYTNTELSATAPDPYQDKKIHRAYRRMTWSTSRALPSDFG